MTSMETTVAKVAGRVRLASQPVYVDRPRPGASYVAANLALAGVLTAGAGGLMALAGAHFGSLAAAALVLALDAHVAVVLHAAYNTVYTVAGGLLSLRCGVWLSGEIELDAVERVEPVAGLPRVAGAGPSGRGFGNRFSNGLRIVTADGTVYVTPSAPDEFARLLQYHRETL